MNRGWKQNLLAAPGIGVSLLPKIACPACWPAYAGLLSSVGLGFLIPNMAYLLPLTAIFLLLAVGMLAFRARRRHGYGPFALGLVSASLVLLGKFSMAPNPMFYAGLGLLIAAFIVWLSHFLGFAAAAAIAGAVLLVIAAITLGMGALALRRRRARQPSLTSEALSMASFGMRMAALVIRRDPSKALLAAIIAGAVAEHFSRDRPKN